MKKILLPVCLLFAIGAAAQKVSNKLSFQKGQTIEVTTNMNMTTQMPMGEIPMTIVSTELYTVGEAAAGQTQITKTVKRMKMNANAMGQEMNMDSDNPKDLEGQMGAPVKEMMKQKQEFTIDATGKIIAVKSGDKKADNGGMSMMMPGLNAGSGVIAVGQASFFKLLPSHEVGKGDTWTDSVNADGNMTKTVYTVKDITATEILLDYTGEIKTKGTQSTMGMSSDVSTTGKTSGTVTIDKATGLLKQKTMSSDVDANVSVGGQEMNTNTKLTATSTVKIL